MVFQSGDVPEHVTLDIVHLAPLAARRWHAAARALLAARPPGLRGGVVVRCNRGTRGSGLPLLVPGGRGVVLGWDDPAAAAEAWQRHGAGLAVAPERRFSADAEVRRVREQDWHGWRPVAAGAPARDDEPAIALVHALLRPSAVVPFSQANRRAVAHARDREALVATTALMRGSLLEATSLSCWSTAGAMREYAYRPGGHADAMRGSQANTWHRRRCFVHLRPVAASGGLPGGPAEAYPGLPAVPRTSRRQGATA